MKSRGKKNRKPSRPSKADQGSVSDSPTLNGTGYPWIIGLLALAFCIALYLGWTHLKQGNVAGCGPASGCEEVLSSRWSSWLGLPVSILALPVYFSLAFSLFQLHRRTGRKEDFILTFTLVVSSLLIGLAALWFIGIQFFVLGKFCPWCMTAHFAGLTAAVLALKWVYSKDQAGMSFPRLTSGQSRLAFVTCFIALAMLVVGQMVYQPRTFESVDLDPGNPPATNETVSVVENENKNEGDTRLELHGGQFKLSALEYPVVGKTGAPYKILSLFDYTCHHCRETHEHIATLSRAFPNDLAILSLPTPLNTDCNPLMKRLGRTTPSAHRDACLLAAMSLAVFRSKPEAWQAYDQWLFTGKEAPALPLAQAEAIRVVGSPEVLNQAMRDPWIRDTVHLAVAIFEANMRAQGEGKMPQLVIGNSLLSGSVNQANDLFRVVQDQFGLQQ